MALTNGTDHEHSEDEVELRVKSLSDSEKPSKTKRHTNSGVTISNEHHTIYFIRSYNAPSNSDPADPEKDAINELSKIRSILSENQLDIVRCKSDSRISLPVTDADRRNIRARSVSAPSPFKNNSFLRRSFNSIWGKSFSRKSKNASVKSHSSSSSGSEKIEKSGKRKSQHESHGGEGDGCVEVVVGAGGGEKCETLHEVAEEDVRLRRNNSTSSSCRSTKSTNSVGFGIRSAPSSPMAPLQGQSDSHGQSVINLSSVTQSPSHNNAGGKLDSRSLKHLSAPVTASTNRSISPHLHKSSSSSSKNDIPPPEKEKEKKRKELSSSRQKKFFRHFQQVNKDERVINYYSCALVSDILLQGHLYITDNYFAFYSNVFGFVTKLLIPTASVVRISKEKTAKIIPNAVGVATADERHVFGSFMSREAAFRLMCSVCQPLEPVEIPKVPDIEVSEECSVEDDSSCSISGNESPPQLLDSTSDASQSLRQRAITSDFPLTPSDSVDGVEKTDIPPEATTTKENSTKSLTSPPTSSSTVPVKTIKSPTPLVSTRVLKLRFPTDLHIVYLGVILTLILTMFSAFLLYRILDFEAKSKNFSSMDFKWESEKDTDNIYEKALRWQKEMQTKSTEEAQIILNSNLEQIARVRRNLETLSLLIHDRKIPASQSYEKDIIVNPEVVVKRDFYITTQAKIEDITTEKMAGSSDNYGESP